ncbi:hypothetical protein LTR23_011278, partial [Exophiala sp. CCFEE 6169]
MAADATQPVSALPLLTAQARAALLASSGAVAAEVPAWTLPSRFAAQVRATPEAEALRFGETSLTYAQLDRASNRVAHALMARGVVPETCVGLCADRSVDLVVGMLGILKAGGAYVPLDPAYPRERVAQMLADSAPAVVVSGGGAAARVGIDPERVLEVASTQAATGYEHTPTVDLRGEHLAYVIYTSGSTGRPKG